MCHDSAVAHDRAAGAPDDEIEITPEMIEAGRSALSRYRYEESNEEKTLAAIFRAMMSSSR
jgi:hypothetical protein